MLGNISRHIFSLGCLLLSKKKKKKVKTFKIKILLQILLLLSRMAFIIPHRVCLSPRRKLGLLPNRQNVKFSMAPEMMGKDCEKNLILKASLIILYPMIKVLRYLCTLANNLCQKQINK